MTAEELMIGYSLGKNVAGNIDADEDVFSEVTGRKVARQDSRQQRGGLFRRGGVTDLYKDAGGKITGLVQGAQKNKTLKQKAKLAEAEGMAKAAQMASMPSNVKPAKDKTMIYVLGGVGLLVVAGLAFYMIKKGKK